MTRLKILILLAILTAGAEAQWQTVGVDDTGSDVEPFAVVGNPAGDRFEVHRRDDGVIEGVLVLREGFETFHPDGCPTFVVDLTRAVSLAEENAPCTAEGARTRFILGRVDDGQVVSPQLVSLMNGHQVVFRFQLAGLGYRETRFPLRRSKNSLNDLLGPGVQATPR